MIKRKIYQQSVYIDFFAHAYIKGYSLDYAAEGLFGAYLDSSGPETLLQGNCFFRLDKGKLVKSRQKMIKKDKSFMDDIITYIVHNIV